VYYFTVTRNVLVIISAWCYWFYYVLILCYICMASMVFQYQWNWELFYYFGNLSPCMLLIYDICTHITVSQSIVVSLEEMRNVGTLN